MKPKEKPRLHTTRGSLSTEVALKRLLADAQGRDEKRVTIGAILSSSLEVVAAKGWILLSAQDGYRFRRVTTRGRIVEPEGKFRIREVEKGTKVPHAKGFAYSKRLWAAADIYDRYPRTSAGNVAEAALIAMIEYGATWVAEKRGWGFSD